MIIFDAKKPCFSDSHIPFVVLRNKLAKYSMILSGNAIFLCTVLLDQVILLKLDQIIPLHKSIIVISIIDTVATF